MLFTSDDYKDMIGKHTSFTLVVDDLDRTYTELRDKGVEFVTPPKKEPWGAFAVFLDSEGNKILIGP